MRSQAKVLPFKRRRSSGAAPVKLLGACLAVFTLTMGCGLAWPHLQDLPGRVGAGAQTTVLRVIDGDTFVLSSGEHVRILNIDTAEMPPRAGCDREAKLALRARARLRTLLRQGRVELVSAGEDRDRCGRLLRRVRVEGRDVGEALIGEGLAQPWRGRRAEWC